MTAPHTGPVVQAPDVADAVAAMRERGLRVSSVRRLMLDALYGSSEPMTADRLAERVGGQTGTDVASIYRNLETARGDRAGPPLPPEPLTGAVRPCGRRAARVPGL